ncbi:hypothetical protein ACWGR4_41455 [Embleya sp. NPDC055664]
MKDLTERIRATFVYAGIDVTATPLFAGVRGAQLAGRACLVECGAFPARLGTREPFKELIAGVETALDPKRTPHRTAPGHSPASRPISTNAPPAASAAPSRLIRQAAITAIDDDTERITTTSLDTVRLDHTAETRHHPPPPGPAHPGDRHIHLSATTRNPVTSTNTIRAFRRTGYVQHTHAFSPQLRHPQAKPRTALTRTATKHSHPTCNTPAHTTNRTPTNHPQAQQ